MIHVPLNNWFDTDFDNIMQQIINIKKNNIDPLIIMTSCGMSSKVLVTELYKLYPNEIYLDIGSGLDTICTKRSTRQSLWNYDYCYNFFKDILPQNWEDPKYNYIYENAQNELGLNVPKDNIVLSDNI